ncbi:LysR family transcriptional regulator [Enterococcus olivae]
MDKFLILQKVIETGSFTLAAEELGYSQSAISQIIHRLENELDIQLLVRSRSGIRLKKDGRDLLPLIEEIIEKRQALDARISHIKKLNAGTVRIGITSGESARWFASMIKDFQELYPNIQFIIKKGSYRSVAKWIETESLDLGLLPSRAAANLETSTYISHPFCAVLPKNHSLGKHSVIELKQLKEETLVVLDQGPFNEILESFNGQFDSRRIKYQVNDPSLLLPIVELGLGVGLLPQPALADHSYEIISRPISPALHSHLSVACKKKENLSFASQQFIEFLLENYEELD